MWYLELPDHRITLCMPRTEHWMGRRLGPGQSPPALGGLRYDTVVMSRLRGAVSEIAPGTFDAWRMSDEQVLALLEYAIASGVLAILDHGIGDEAARRLAERLSRSPDTLTWQAEQHWIATLGQCVTDLRCSRDTPLPYRQAWALIEARAQDAENPFQADLHAAQALLHEPRAGAATTDRLMVFRRVDAGTTASGATNADAARVITPRMLAAAMGMPRDEELHWIEVKLVDDHDKPVKGVPCDIRLPNGSKFGAATDEDGLVRWDGEPSGECQIRFPQFDGAVWKPAFPARPDAPRAAHVVKQGECLSRIAWAYGFVNWRIVYQHPSNADLRRLRPDPDVLHPGDVVNIPIFDDKPWPGATDERHVFKLRAPRRPLQIVLLDEDRAPLVDEPCTARVGRVLLYGCTDDKGLLSLELPVDAKLVELWVAGTRRHLELGAFNPLSEVKDDGISGVQGRLKALGFDPGPADGVVGPRTRAALVAFQRHHGLRRSARADGETLAKLSSECRP